MKKYLLMLAFSAGVFTASAGSAAQDTLERFVVASSGGYDVVGAISISYTIGELAAVESFTTNPLMHLTQGFQQPEAWYTGIKTNIVANSDFSVYPNPASEVVTLRFDGVTDGAFTVELFDVLGQKIKEIKYTRTIGQTDYTLDLSDISQGLYVVRLTGKINGRPFESNNKLNVIY